MFQKNALLKALIAAGLTSGLIACGGGGSSDSPNTSTPDQPTPEASAQTGAFVDSAVGGLEYETTSGMRGITNDSGEFNYKEGDEIRFNVGAFNLGTANGADLLTPFNLTANDEAKATNIARFLQTLDNDGIPDNGIVITESTRAKAANENSTDVATINLADATMADTITGLTSENTVPQTSVVSAEDALDHLNGTIDSYSPVENCNDSRAQALTADHLIGKSFGFIKTDEIAVFQFDGSGSAGTFTEFQYDEQSGGLKDGVVTGWSLANNTLTFDQNESFGACATDSYVILETAEGSDKLYNVKPFALPTTETAYIIANGGEDRAVLTVGPTGSLDYFPSETPISENSSASAGSNGALVLDFDEGGVLDYVFFLKGQGNAIYIDNDEAGNLASIGTTRTIPAPRAVDEATFAGKTVVWRDNAANEIVIRTYNADHTLHEYANDYSADGQQIAVYAELEWSWISQYGLLEEYDNSDLNPTTPFKVADTGTKLIYAEQSQEEKPLFELHKTQAISSNAFAGNYIIDIPTENTRFNNLEVRADGSCTYSGTDCNWSIDTSGKVEVIFSHDQTATGHIWKLANSTTQFAFVMTHSDNTNDVEPGLMVRN